MPLRSPDIGFVEPLLKRRLSSLARIVLSIVNECAQDVTDARIVFASRHGELARTTTMLESLSIGEELSPTLFSMSVLNASAGIFSILKKNTTPSTAISAGDASFGYGLMEACLQVAENPGQPVLFVYADEPAPADYAVCEPGDRRPFALALLLDASAHTRVSISSHATTAAPSDERQAQSFVRTLKGGESAWRESGRTWFWKREA